MSLSGRDPHHPPSHEPRVVAPPLAAAAREQPTFRAASPAPWRRRPGCTCTEVRVHVCILSPPAANQRALTDPHGPGAAPARPRSARPVTDADSVTCGALRAANAALVEELASVRALLEEESDPAPTGDARRGRLLHAMNLQLQRQVHVPVCDAVPPLSPTQLLGFGLSVFG
jgi:hypothetical protein